MAQIHSYTISQNHPVSSIIQGVDHDVERGEDIIMLGYGLVLAAPMFAPIAPPHILIPLMALAFFLSVCIARNHFHNINARLKTSMDLSPEYDFSILKPIFLVFAEHPKHSLSDGFNPIKNLLRTAKSLLGSLMINPFWMPVFYLLGMQIVEEKQMQALNKAVIEVERRTQV